MRQTRIVFLLSIVTMLLPGQQLFAQLPVITLQPGVPVEKTIGPGQTHAFAVNLEDDQYVQLVVDQRGIDIVVRVFSPTRKDLGQFDSPNGNNGPENVSFVATSPGAYSILVTPLNQGEGVAPGKYEIKIIELRHATDQELKTSKNQEALKAKAIALISEVADTVQQIRQLQTRVRTQLQAADLLWASNEKLALKLTSDAMTSIREYLSAIEISDEDYYQTYQSAIQLRTQVIQTVAPHDPDMALNFLRSTAGMINPNGQRAESAEQAQLELSLATLIISKDPKRAFQIAEDNLKSRPSGNLMQMLFQLRSSAPDLATKLASDMATKLQNEKIVESPELADLAQNLISIGRPSRAPETSGPNTSLLSEQEYRDLVQKALSEALSYNPPAINAYTAERNSVQNLLSILRSLGSNIDGFVPGAAAAVDKRLNELSGSSVQTADTWRQLQNSINEGSTEVALETIRQAPPELQQQFYQQISEKLAGGGELLRARQIVSEHLTNPFQRHQALMNLDQQAIYNLLTKGKVEDALRMIGTLRSARMRDEIIARIAGQIGPGQKRAQAINLLEIARSMIGTSVQAESQDQLVALLELGKAFSRYDAKRAFELIEPLIDQFNEMAEAAHSLNGFGQEYYQGNELIMQNGNSVANVGTQLLNALGELSLTNFDRAKTDADRIGLVEVRIGAYVAIAQQAIKQGE